jgi:hypothetical protein
MTMTTTTIRIGIEMLPDHLDRSRPNAVAEVVEAALLEGGIKADFSDRRCQTNANQSLFALPAPSSGSKKPRHSARAAARFSLKVCRV